MASHSFIKLSNPQFTANPNIDGQRLLRVAIGSGAGGLLGAALGASGGLLGEAFLTPSEKAQYLRRMLQGAGIGGLVGLGLGAGFGSTQTAADMHHNLNNLLDDITNNFNKNLNNLAFDVKHPIIGTTRVSLSSNNTAKQPPRAES